MLEATQPQTEQYLPIAGNETFWARANGTSKVLHPLINYWETKFNAIYSNPSQPGLIPPAAQSLRRHSHLFEDIQRAIVNADYEPTKESLESLASIASELVTLDVVKNTLNAKQETLNACFGLEYLGARLSNLWEDISSPGADILIDLRVLNKERADIFTSKDTGERITLGIDVTYEPAEMRKSQNNCIDLSLSIPGFGQRYAPDNYLNTARSLAQHPNGLNIEDSIYQDRLVTCVNTQFENTMEYLREHSPANPWRAIALSTFSPH